MKYCSMDAFVRCPLDERCKNFREACFVEGSECDSFNQSILNRPMSAADQIRNMSDKELAAYLLDIAGDGFSRKYCDSRHCTDADDACDLCLLRYLQSPVNGGAGNGSSLSGF